MRSLGFISLAALLVGCAGSSAIAGTHGMISRPEAHATSIQYFEDASLVVDTVGAPPAQVWPHLVLAYRALGIPITTLDSTTATVGAVRVPVRQKLGGHQISHYLSCGSTITGQLMADAYRVSMTAVTQLRPTSNGTAVRTSVSATAQDQSGNSSDPVQCGSTGAMERDIAAALHTAP